MKTPTLSMNGVDRQPVSTNGSAMSGGPPLARTPLPTRQRRSGWTALGGVLVIGIAAAFGYLYSSAGSKEPVVVVTAPVAVGEVISRSDLLLTDTQFAHDGVKYVQRNCGQLLERRRHPRAHVRGDAEGPLKPSLRARLGTPGL